MARELNFNRNPFLILGEVDRDEEVFCYSNESYRDIRTRGHKKGKGKFSQPFVPLTEIPFIGLNPEEILLKKEAGGV